MFLTKFVEKIKTRTLCSITPPQKNHAFYDLMWKITTAGQTTDICST